MFPARDSATLARLQFVTEPPGTYRLPTTRSEPRPRRRAAVGARPGRGRGLNPSPPRGRTFLEREPEAVLVRAREPGAPSPLDQPDVGLVDITSRTTAAVPSLEESSTTSTSTSCGALRTPRSTCSIVARPRRSAGSRGCGAPGVRAALGRASRSSGVWARRARRPGTRGRARGASPPAGRTTCVDRRTGWCAEG